MTIEVAGPVIQKPGNPPEDIESAWWMMKNYRARYHDGVNILNLTTVSLGTILIYLRRGEIPPRSAIDRAAANLLAVEAFAQERSAAQGIDRPTSETPAIWVAS